MPLDVLKGWALSIRLDNACEGHSELVDLLLDEVEEIMAGLEGDKEAREKAELSLRNLHAALYNAPRTEEDRAQKAANQKALLEYISTPGNLLHRSVKED